MSAPTTREFGLRVCCDSKSGKFYLAKVSSPGNHDNMAMQTAPPCKKEDKMVAGVHCHVNGNPRVSDADKQVAILGFPPPHLKIKCIQIIKFPPGIDYAVISRNSQCQEACLGGLTGGEEELLSTTCLSPSPGITIHMAALSYRRCPSALPCHVPIDCWLGKHDLITTIKLTRNGEHYYFYFMIVNESKTHTTFSIQHQITSSCEVRQLRNWRNHIESAAAIPEACG